MFTWEPKASHVNEIMAGGVTWSKLESCLKLLNTNTAHPEQFLSLQDGLASDFTSLTKTLYDLHKAEETAGAVGSPLKELVIGHFDEEQIWQELELQNDSVLSHFQKAVMRAAKGDDIGLLPEEESEEEEEDATGSVEDSGSEEDLDQEDLGEDKVGDLENHESKDRDSEPEEESEKANRKSTAKNTAFEKFSDEDSDVDFDVDALEKQTQQRQKKTERQGGGSIVDDRFFRLAEMEAFLEDVEKKEEKGEGGDSDIDYFEDMLSEDEEMEDDDIVSTNKKKQQKSSRDLKYKDFFDPEGGPAKQVSVKEDEDEDLGSDGEEYGQEDEEMEEEMEDDEEDEMEENVESRQAKEALKKVTFDLSEDSEGEDVSDILGGKRKEPEKPGPKSSFEKRQEKMAEKIQELEKAALENKPWQLIGEVSGQKRPDNSLLEENLVFDQAARMAPVITEETTLYLDDIIKQRIKDQAWDDVVRKEKPKEDAFEYKKRLTLAHEKSKLSLAEVYEQEYLKQTQQKAEEEENPAHLEIQKMMDSLFLKLDALSNFQFIPKPPAPEVKIVSNMPSITMEEVAPVSVSNAALLAPEEIKVKNKAGDIKGDAEKTATDKKRERRKKKILKRLKQREREKRQKLREKMNEGKNLKYTKKEAAENLKKLAKDGKTTLLKDEGKDKALRSSQAFFSELQDQVKRQLKGAKNDAAKKKKHKEVSAIKLKL
ncbi:U3 small nucleolar ribonucleoprotein protein MPP10-like isoform X1 [Acipenser ruthenus]|uniref:U3 small nucleolar ribonucleoprotein protein MPP10-like isoform X1 n=1 Tax=Acipenser ruthenus TaxID=7906 RepID=UPI0015604E12|nr:U3 small nucleolar ribonucleoprotein protein MPP10-like isoform X1 [Acipenser ruthenus]XP_058854782.1 U3 small nucleolar ribonucleoprotein protein MPP10-like isoform X1 [Acipenser ruthenus]